MTDKEIMEKANFKSLLCDTKYAEDSEFSDMLVNPLKYQKETIVNMANILIRKAWCDGYVDGARENAPKWHYLSKGELPDTKEDERILFFVKDTNVYDGSPYQHFALGFYKSISYKGGKKMFSEQSKGYSCDFLPEEVIAWQYIKLPKGK